MIVATYFDLISDRQWRQALSLPLQRPRRSPPRRANHAIFGHREHAHAEDGRRIQGEALLCRTPRGQVRADSVGGGVSPAVRAVQTLAAATAASRLSEKCFHLSEAVGHLLQQADSALTRTGSCLNSFLLCRERGKQSYLITGKASHSLCDILHVFYLSDNLCTDCLIEWLPRDLITLYVIKCSMILWVHHVYWLHSVSIKKFLKQYLRGCHIFRHDKVHFKYNICWSLTRTNSFVKKVLKSAIIN